MLPPFFLLFLGAEKNPPFIPLPNVLLSFFRCRCFCFSTFFRATEDSAIIWSISVGPSSPAAAAVAAVSCAAGAAGGGGWRAD